MLSLSGVSKAAGVSYYEREDYYFKGQEGETVLGREEVGEKLDRKNFERLIDERIKATGGDVEGKDKVAEDLTFSAPKSVSLVAALDRDRRSDIFRAHQEAVKSVMEYIKDRGMIQTRENGKVVRADGIIAVRFDHFTNRNGDPQLHSHVLILNRVRDTQGNLKATYLKEIYQNKIALGTLYRHELASNLERLGYKVEWSQDGTFEIKGFTKEQLQRFSTRRAEIEKALNERNLESGGKAAEVAALDTRKSKQEYNIQELEKKWQGAAKEAGIQVPDPVREEVTQEKIIEDRIKAVDVKNIVEEATQKQIETAGFTQTHRVELDIAKVLAQQGITANIENIKRYAQEGLKYMQERDGGLISLGQDNVGREYITTQDVLNAELRSREAGRERESLDLQRTQEILSEFNEKLFESKGFKLDEYQLDAIKRIATSSRDAIVVGKAGAGKTTMMEALKEVYKQQGKEVIGVAPTGAAAYNLEKEAGIRSYTIDSLCFQEKKMDPAKLKGGLLIVDEAGMLDARRDAAIQEFAEKFGMKILRVGDPDQVKPVGHGDPFAHKVIEEMNRAESTVFQDKLQEALTHYLNEQQRINSKLQEFYLLHGSGDKYAAIEANEDGYKVLRENLKIEHLGNENNFIENLESALKYDGNAEHKQRLEKALAIYKERKAELEGLGVTREAPEVERAKEREQIAELHRRVEQDLIKEVKGIIQDKKYENLFILDKIYRQKEAKYREVALKAALGKTAESLEQAKENGWIKEISARKDRIEAAAQEYLHYWKENKNTLLVTESNVIKNRLNKEIRYNLQKEGFIEKEGIKIEIRGTDGKKQGEREFVKGDVVQFLRNDKRLGVMNGQIGKVQEIDRKEGLMVVKVGNEEKTIDLKQYNYLDYGYATTIHKSQGQTVDRVIYFHDSKKAAGMTSKNLYYVAISRGREGMTVYTDNYDKLREKITEAQQKKDVLAWYNKNVDREKYQNFSAQQKIRESVAESIARQSWYDMSREEKRAAVGKEHQFSARQKIEESIIENTARQTWDEMSKEEKQAVVANVFKERARIEEKAQKAWQRSADWYPQYQPSRYETQRVVRKTQRSVLRSIIDLARGQYFVKRYYESIARGESFGKQFLYATLADKSLEDIFKDRKAFALAKDNVGLFKIALRHGLDVAARVKRIRRAYAIKAGNIKEAFKYGGIEAAIDAAGYKLAHKLQQALFERKQRKEIERKEKYHERRHEQEYRQERIQEREISR